MKAALNGFGRIGRAVMRQILSNHPDIDVVAINDIAPLDMLAYLFRYDSTYGPFHGDVRTEEGHLILNERRIPVTQTADLRDLAASDADILLECTGKMRSASEAQTAAARSGARDVLISGPCDATVATVVMGANDGDLGTHRVVSNASCTTNAIAPLVALVDAQFGVTAGHVTTVHCYTNSQPLVDGPRATPARSRAAAQSMIPTTTSATDVVTQVLPHLAGRLTGAAIRVPTVSVSCIDAVLHLQAPVPDVRHALRPFIDNSPVMDWTEDPLVSVDLRGHPASLIVAGPEVMQPAPDQIRVFGWYDNEWGFSARMIDMARRMTKRS